MPEVNPVSTCDDCAAFPSSTVREGRKVCEDCAHEDDDEKKTAYPCDGCDNHERHQRSDAQVRIYESDAEKVKA